MKRILTFSLALVFSLAVLPVFAENAPEVSAQSAILIDAKDACVLIEKDADARLSMASTTKIMTAVLVLETCDLSDVVRIPREAAGVEGSSAYLYENEQILVRDLVYALLLQSANDAAAALAIHACGSVDAFVEQMNAKAQTLGLKDTHFVNPHGLPAEEHYSTARDLAFLMRYALQNSFFTAIVGTRAYTTDPRGFSEGEVHYFRHHNRLLSSYPDCIGGKTGFTKEAGRCLVSAAERGGATLICVTLNAPDDWNDHASLFEFGFSQYSEQTLLEKGEVNLTIPVVGGTLSEVRVTNTEALSCSLRNADGITICYDLPHFAYAPITGTDQMESGVPAYSLPMRAGRAYVYQNGVMIAQKDLYYQTTGDEYIPPTLWERICQFFGWKKSGSKNS